MKTLILCATKWGSTEQYAKWISEAASGCSIKAVDDFKPSDALEYDKIVVGSRTYMGKITATDFLVDNWQYLSQKPVYLFSVGIISPDHPDSLAPFLLIPANIREKLSGYVKLPGKIDMSKINWLQRLIVKLIKPEKMNLMHKEAINPVVEFIHATNVQN